MYLGSWDSPVLSARLLYPPHTPIFPRDDARNKNRQNPPTGFRLPTRNFSGGKRRYAYNEKLFLEITREGRFYRRNQLEMNGCALRAAA